MKPLRIAIFASGTGSNAMTLINKIKTELPQTIEVAFLLSDQFMAPVLSKASEAGVRCYFVPKVKNKSTHEQEILDLLYEHRIDWICLAGYMRLLSEIFLQTFANWHRGASQIANIHPSLLPAYPGVHSIARAYADKVSVTGVTLHLVDAGMDTGPILMQKSLELTKEESLEQFEKRIHELEYEIYAQFVEDLSLGRIKSVSFEESM